MDADAFQLVLRLTVLHAIPLAVEHVADLDLIEALGSWPGVE